MSDSVKTVLQVYFYCMKRVYLQVDNIDEFIESLYEKAINTVPASLYGDIHTLFTFTRGSIGFAPQELEAVLVIHPYRWDEIDVDLEELWIEDLYAIIVVTSRRVYRFYYIKYRDYEEKKEGRMMAIEVE